MISFVALLLHAALLGETQWAQWAWPEAQAVPHAAAMQVRTIEAVPRPAIEAAAEVIDTGRVSSPPVARVLPGAAARRAPRPVALDAVPEPNLDAALEPAAQTVSIDGMELAAFVAPKPRLEAAPASAPASAGSAMASGDEPIPHYRTQLPRAATLRYQVSKGMLHGTGELQWRPQSDRYEITLESKLAGMTLLTQVSSGVFDSEGIAPQRFTDTRLRRSTVAANFQRDQRKITFSGAREEFPLWPGVQDRVSWMVQLAAIVSAQPELRVPGAKVAMHVVGANADASVWAFECVGNESVRTDLGPVNAIKYVREPRGPHDTTAQAWLDPTHHFLPARATLRSGPDDEGYELRLQDVVGAP